jgi:hypothetical protein
MKTYEEMAQSVIHRAKAHKTVRNRWIAGSVAAVLTLCACAWGLGNRPQPDAAMQDQTVALPEVTTVAVPADSLRVTFLSSDGSQTAEMKQDVETPCLMEVRVKDVHGLSEEEKAAIVEAEKQYADALVAAHSEAKGYNWTQFDSGDVVVTSISAGHFVIGMEDPKQIESIYATVRGDVCLGYMPFADEKAFWENPDAPVPTEYALSHEQILKQYYAPYGGIGISWMLSSASDTALEKGTASIGDLSDTITFTVTCVDGTVETHSVDMIFNDDGKVYAIYRGAEAVA